MIVDNIKKGMRIVSVFDGMSTVQVAVDRLGIPVDKYYSAEIDVDAITVTHYNYPNTVHVGDITELNGKDYKDIDLFVGGSPCQSFSLAGRKKGMITSDKLEVTTLDQYLNLRSSGYEFEGASYLFWEYVRLLKEINPKYFLLENVIMSPKWKRVITDALGVEPHEINSSKFSIQSRRRLYWTNIPFDKNIEDREIYFYDEYSREYDESLVLRGRGINKIGKPRSRVCSIHDSKLPTLLHYQKAKATDSIIINHDGVYRYPTRAEAEKMQNIPIGYTDAVGYNNAMGLLGNGMTADVIAHILKPLKEVKNHNKLTAHEK